MAQALVINLTGVTATKSLGNILDRAFAPSVTNGLEGWFNLGGSTATAVKNRAPGKADATAVGGPTFDVGGFANLKSLSTFFQTAITETADMSILVACASADTLASIATTPAFIGSGSGPSQADAGIASDGVIIFPAGTGVRMQGYRRASDGSQEQAYAVVGNQTPLTTFRCYLGRISGLNVYMKNMTSGADAGTWSYTKPRYPSSLPLRIGSGYSSNAGTSKIAAVGIWSRALSDAEGAQAYADMQAYLSKRWGLVI